MAQRPSSPARAQPGLLTVTSPHPGVRVLALNHPRKANALSTPLTIELCEQLQDAHDSRDVACVVLTGSDRVFCAGADIAGMVAHGVDWYLDPQRLERWRQIQDFPKPLIAAVNGPAIGGGCELAMLCDIIVAGENASFSQGEINIGVMPGDGGTQRLPRVVGKSLAMYMILSGEPITAQRAYDAGLVLEVTPVADTLARAAAIAARIAAHAPLSVRHAKRSTLDAFEQPLAEGLVAERRRVAELFDTHDRLEGMRAFLEKRTPRYEGR